MTRVRSPRLVPTYSSDNPNLSPSVPLEFDEEDEDFLLKDLDPSSKGLHTETICSEETPRRTVTPPTGALDEEDAWVGGQAGVAGLDDAEPFDHISAAGFLDEEQTAAVEAPKAPKGRKGRKKQQI
ncbi:hypothetical protein PM082_007494 [Marasmius tenuissimus]|nr:hypothetical protein PM082_007494 [Marasmius tenuissimus]